MVALAIGTIAYVMGRQTLTAPWGVGSSISPSPNPSTSQIKMHIGESDYSNCLNTLQSIQTHATTTQENLSLALNSAQLAKNIDNLYGTAQVNIFNVEDVSKNLQCPLLMVDLEHMQRQMIDKYKKANVAALHFHTDILQANTIILKGGPDDLYSQVSERSQMEQDAANEWLGQANTLRQQLADDLNTITSVSQ